jgi:ABC-type dipeptide/oligopeptide/nickel transport system ATPase component
MFTWEELNYHVPTPSGPLRLLHDVYGYVKPGTLTALMGASGAGMSLVHDSESARALSIVQGKPHASMSWLSEKILASLTETSLSLGDH